MVILDGVEEEAYEASFMEKLRAETTWGLGRGGRVLGVDQLIAAGSEIRCHDRLRFAPVGVVSEVAI